MIPCPTCQNPVVSVDCTIDPRTMAHVFTANCGHRLGREATVALYDAGMRWDMPVIDGPALLRAERRRQITEEGYTPAHDATHGAEGKGGSDLGWAAWCYLDRAATGIAQDEVPTMWPWAEEAWKPEHSPLRMLVIAGALIAAEIDRMLVEERTTTKKGTEQ
jgi:hypothetical protein